MSYAFKINLQAPGKPVTCYSNFGFNGFAVKSGVAFGSKSDGIHSLFDSDNDNGVDIESEFEWWADFGSWLRKKIRMLILQMSATGYVNISVGVDDGSERTYTLQTDRVGTRNMYKVAVGKEVKGTHWRFRVSNTNGCRMSVGKVSGAVVIVGN